ncbi:Phosphatidylinositol-4-phosphate 5-kinase family protein [Perilla frutescens var. hirtella]|uniref:Phosphatidylinositol 4-phosphate 5-kinase n=1 Tax=Perilla frutescens var. hirtella TaxID=608512 RepID=A0AAD4IY00_PERFH|nr:Phosphatidylinositol-4-phosphate 5-kinase family protein [Perilla frutescens var. hirtella]
MKAEEHSLKKVKRIFGPTTYSVMENDERGPEKILINGDAYLGAFEGTIPHGKGKYTWSDGTIYEGDWEEGKMSGKGKIRWPSQAMYDGDFSGGYLHGFGTFIGSDGSMYRGSWKMNSQHGIGRKQYPNADIYDGCWREGVREGSGRYAWSNDNIYLGNWKNGRMSGRGVMKWFNGDLFDGFWLNGLRHGTGCYRFGDGSYYFGTWSNGLKDGPGTFYPAGNKHLSKLNLERYKDKRNRLLSHMSSDESVIPSVKRTLSDKISSSFRRGSGGFSRKTSLLNDDLIRTGSMREMMSHERSVSVTSISSHDGPIEYPENRTVAFEREYMQGVLMKERVKNISKLSHRSKQRLKFAKDAERKSCVNIFEGHSSYYLMLSLQLGIRYTVGKITPVPMREVRSSDFGEQARIRMYFPRKGSQLTPPHHSIDFYWKDYCPMVFRNLRDLFKLNAADYMMSICGDDGLRELSSPGKSGSIFYLSHDDRFVIKTLKKTELKVLLKMLPHYYRHVQAHDNTLITKFFGAHRITLKHGKKVRFVVMGNMFCTELRIHRRYDLKGSVQGRFTNKDEIDESTTLKDLDLTYEFHMDRSLHEALFRQLSLDSAFLESQQIIDYSLLLGLHFRAPEHLKSLLEPPESPDKAENSNTADGVISQGGEILIPPRGLVLVTHEPGSVSTEPGPHIRGDTLKAYSIGNKEADVLLPGTGRLRVQLGVNMPAQANHKIVQAETDSAEIELFEVYDVVLYLGIIDILQEYNLKKKLEHACKSLKFDPVSISVVEPKIYSKRFITFLEKIFPVQP